MFKRYLPALLALIAAVCLAAVPSTQVADLWTDSAGHPVNGTITITWPSFVTADGTAVPGGNSTYTITSGVVNISLAPTVGGTVTQTGAPIIPAYTVSFYNPSASQSTTQTWSIPGSGTPLTMSSVQCPAALGCQGSGVNFGSTSYGINGTTIPRNTASDQTIVTTSPQVGAWSSLPLCLDSLGQHLNYNTATHQFSCGTTSSSGSGGGGGSGATVAVGTTTTGAPGSSASVTNSGTSSSAIFNFTIPQGATGSAGATGPQGPTGATGATGVSPTVAIGTTTTLAAGASATVTDSGTAPAHIFNFGIPQGAAGASGSGTGTVNTGSAGQFAYFAANGTTVSGHTLLASDIPVLNYSPILTFSGTGSKTVSASAAGVSGNCVKWLSTGDIGDAGAACGSGSGSSLPSQTGFNGASLITNGTAASWGSPVTAGPSGALDCTPADFGGVYGECDVVTSVVPRLAAANLFTGLNKQTPSAAATSSANQSPNPFEDEANYWNGAGSSPDDWWWSIVLGTGTNPTTTYTLNHSGSPGAASLNIPFPITVPSCTGCGSSGGGSGTVGTGTANQFAYYTAGGTSVAGHTLVSSDIPTIANTQVSGLATSATTDTTNATNITSGTLPAAQLPATAVTQTEAFTLDVTKAPYYASGSSVTTSLTAAATAGATSIQVASASSFSPNQGILIGVSGANASTTTFIGTVQSVSGNTITLTTAITSGSSYAIGANVQHDDSVAVQSVINYLAANGGGLAKFPLGFYRANNCNAAGNNSSVWTFPNVTFSWGSPGSPMANITPISFDSLYSGGVDSASSVPTIQTDCVAGSLLNSPASISSSGFLAVSFGTRHITYRSYPNPSVTMLDLSKLGQMNGHSDITIDTGTTFPPIQPTNATGIALLTPTHGNFNYADIENLNISGYYTASILGAHTNIKTAHYAWNWQGIGVNNQGDHAIHIDFIDMERAHYSIYPYTSTTGVLNAPEIQIDHLQVENDNDAYWTGTTTNIQDPSGLLYCDIKYEITKNSWSNNGGVHCMATNVGAIGNNSQVHYLGGIKFGAAATNGLYNVTGNGGNSVTGTGAGVSGNCAKWDANGNVVDAGAPCGSGGGGSGTVNSASSGQFAYYSATGTAVSGHTLSASDVNALGALTNSTSGNAATATALATTPTLCTTGQAAGGVLANGNATGCFTPSTGGGGSGTVASGTAGQFGYYSSSGTAIAGRTLVASDIPTITSSQVSGLATSATTDTTNASNIASGTIAAARIPTLNQSTTGNASTATALAATPTQASGGQFCTGITAAGNCNSAQVQYSQIGGTPSIAAANVTGLAASATTDTTNATNITSGTLSDSRLATDQCVLTGYNVTYSNISALTPVTAPLYTGLGITLTTSQRICFIEIRPTSPFAATGATAMTARLQSSASTPVIYSPAQDITNTNANTFWSDAGSMADLSTGGQSINVQFIFPGATAAATAGAVHVVVGVRTIP